nr:helix-turn-helix transcriptional regulator [uncultured Sphaerochaeta sp.]
MQVWEAIQRVLDVIETEEMSIGELAKVASLSPFYFQRLFARLVGMPVGEYVRLRRLARSCEALTDTQLHILDIALQFGFSDHANYTRAFRDAYGLTPQEYRQHPVHLNHCIKADASLRYAEHEEGVPLIADDMVVEVNRRRLENPRFLKYFFSWKFLLQYLLISCLITLLPDQVPALDSVFLLNVMRIEPCMYA